MKCIKNYFIFFININIFKKYFINKKTFQYIYILKYTMHIPNSK